jgi:hypothetical protein
MGVGNLNVSVTASTRAAVGELKAFRFAVEQAGLAAERTSAQFAGNTIADYSKRFIPPKIKPEVDAAPIEEATEALREQRNVAKELKRAFGDLKNVVGAVFIAPTVLTKSFEFGQQAGSLLAKGFSIGWARTGDEVEKSIGGAIERWLDPGLHAAKQNRAKAEAEGQKKAWEQAKKDKAKAEAEAADLKRDFEQQLRAAKFDEREAQLGGPAAHFADDKERFGKAKALELLEARERAEAEIAERDRKKRDEEKALQAEKKRQLEAEKKERQHERAMLKEKKTIEDLRTRVREFGLSDLDKERNKVLRELTDPGRRLEARGLFGQLERLQASKDNAKLLAEASKQGISADDPLSRAGNKQRVASLRQNDLTKIARDQLEVQRQTRDAVQQFAKQTPIVLAPAGLAG